MIRGLFCAVVGIGVLLYIKGQDLNHVSGQMVGLGIAAAFMTVYGVLSFFTNIGRTKH